MCGSNHSQFLIWAVEKLIGFVSTCQRCSEEHEKKTVIAEIQPTGENDNGSSSSSSSNKALANPSGNNNNNNSNTKCLNCDNCNDQLEQLFSCLFGYKKSRVKYLANHTATKIEYTLENSLHLYKFFKPEEFPEYDSLKKLPNEVNNFFCNLLLEFIHC